MPETLQLDDFRASILIPVEQANQIHIVPKSFFTDVIKGRRKITELEYWESIVPVIISDWLGSFDED